MTGIIEDSEEKEFCPGCGGRRRCAAHSFSLLLLLLFLLTLFCILDFNRTHYTHSVMPTMSRHTHREKEAQIKEVTRKIILI